MKYRSDFVTNSSSSSFIIAVKDITAVLISEGVKITPNVRRLADSYMELISGCVGEGSPATTFSDLEDYKKHVCEDYGFDTFEEAVAEDGKWLSERVEKVQAAFDAGYAVLQLDVDYNDETRCDMLNGLPSSPDNEAFAYVIEGN